MVQSLPLQSQQSRGDFHHFAHSRIAFPLLGFHTSESDHCSQTFFRIGCSEPRWIYVTSLQNVKVDRKRNCDV